jgi:hypothetical protein
MQLRDSRWQRLPCDCQYAGQLITGSISMSVPVVPESHENLATKGNETGRDRQSIQTAERSRAGGLCQINAQYIRRYYFVARSTLFEIGERYQQKSTCRNRII